MGGPAQGNIAVSVGNDGVFLVDSMDGQMHEKIVAAVRALTAQPIRCVVNTHLHRDHTGGNAAMAKLGAVLISQENMRKRMAGAQNTPAAWPTKKSLALSAVGAIITASQPAKGALPVISPQSPSAGCQYLLPRFARLGPLCDSQRERNSRTTSRIAVQGT
jgi:glyoxylase-like metal-dependent hydrolase (beta-lactamase superfamily II)